LPARFQRGRLPLLQQLDNLQSRKIRSDFVHAVNHSQPPNIIYQKEIVRAALLCQALPQLVATE
jgi:hypothetical protein